MPDPRENTPAGELTPEQVAGHEFPTARRGADPDAVRRYLKEVAAALAAARTRESELRRALNAAEARADSPEIDEATLTAALGQETAKVLRAAHGAARDIVQRAEARAGELSSAAEALLAERTTEAQEEAGRLAEAARERADALFEEARADCRNMIDEAREARRRILQDLAARRRAMHLQIEQIRAAKDALVEIVERAAGSVGEIRDRLTGSEAAARRAAAGAEALAALEDIPLEELVSEALAVVDAEPEPIEAAELEDNTAPADAASPSDSPQPTEPAEPVDAAEPGELAGIPAAPAAADDGAAGPAVQEAAAATVDEVALAPASTVETDAPLAAAGVESLADNGASDHEGVAQAVDELFARIRASRASEVAEARAVLAADDSAVLSGESTIDPAASAPPALADPPAPGGDMDSEQGEQGAAEVLSGPGARRDELVAPAVADLERSLKRELRSDQNELLAAARGLGAHGDLLALVPGTESRSRIAEAVQPGLAAALAAGGTFVAEQVDDPSETGVSPDGADALADELADEVVGAVRGVLADLLADAGGGDESVRVVGAAYREWKGERVTRLAGDYATRAFARGVLAAASTRALAVRWGVDERAHACPECDDNALAEPQRPGDAFPTGQQTPPVHPGCRCLLLPAPS